ncbi:MAG: hypothetical protein CMJ46_09150, partial [Planctomyces sp.]|nr:hypothetical protein [Planctomyces sp.]
MWCPTCRKEVEDRPDGRLDAAECPDCAGTLLDAPPAPAATSPNKTGDALKLLERWSDQRMFSPEGELPQLKGSAPLEKPVFEIEPAPKRSASESPAT